MDEHGITGGRRPTAPPLMGPDETSLPRPILDQAPGVLRAAHGGSRCGNESCVANRKKLKEAMLANRAWERRFNELYRESKTYTQDLERRLKECETTHQGDRHPEKPAPSAPQSSSALIEDLRRQLEDERRRSRDFRRSVEVLDKELRAARAELETARRSGDQREVDMMRQQLQVMKDDFDKVRRDVTRIKSEKEALRGQLVMLQQQATTSQANFMAARREKEEIIRRLHQLTGSGPLGRNPLYESGGYGDEDG